MKWMVKVDVYYIDGYVRVLGYIYVCEGDFSCVKDYFVNLLEY